MCAEPLATQGPASYCTLALPQPALPSRLVPILGNEKAGDNSSYLVLKKGMEGRIGTKGDTLLCTSGILKYP